MNIHFKKSLLPNIILNPTSTDMKWVVKFLAYFTSIDKKIELLGAEILALNSISFNIRTYTNNVCF
jgi:hypothetical protein